MRKTPTEMKPDAGSGAVSRSGRSRKADPAKDGLMNVASPARATGLPW